MRDSTNGIPMHDISEFHRRFYRLEAW